jgi:sulfoacetaldehyde acetyltransferase
VIARADVVLALGSRLGPFGTLPQHGLDYWPKTPRSSRSMPIRA